jgi:hypothetical protein
VRDVEADARHALDHRGGRRRAGHHAAHRMVDAGAQFGGAAISRLCTMGAAQ